MVLLITVSINTAKKKYQPRSQTTCASRA